MGRDSDKKAPGRRLLVVQNSGDYRETWHRLRSGGGESYFAQAYSDQAIASLVDTFDRVAVVAGYTDAEYREDLTDRLVAIGLGPGSPISEASIVEVATQFDPTHLILRAPFEHVLRWACDRGVVTLLTLADSFPTGPRGFLYRRRLVRLMNHASVTWVGNHGIPASRALVRLGVAADKVIPWDWPHARTPDEYRPKVAPVEGACWNALYVGSQSEAKGVSDAIRAVSILAAGRIDVHLDLVGSGDDFSSLARELGVSDRVTFRGAIPNAEVIAAMRAADVVLVPSRKESGEGFPLTIYEALCARTPIVASDHPMFVGKLQDNLSAVLFSAGDAASLAQAIARLIRTPTLFESLSLASLKTWQGLQIPVKWADLVLAWAGNSPTGSKWLHSQSWHGRSYE